MPRVRVSLVTSLALLALAQAGCAMHHLARTVGEGNGELSISAGGPLFLAPYAGLEALWGGDDASGHPFGLAVEAGWVSPFTNSVSVISWEPAGLGAVYVQLGFRIRFGGLDR